MNKELYIKDNNYLALRKLFLDMQLKNVFLVCGKSVEKLAIYSIIKEIFVTMNIRFVKFSEYDSNPKYESVVKGVELFNKNKCDSIFSIGGGSAIDVAKCIKLYSKMDPKICFLNQPIVCNDLPLIVLPTTAGTGSEATRFAVIYYNEEKQSVSDWNCIPDVVIFDSTVLKSLSDYQRKVTMLDALCHSLESFWSVNSTEESILYSKKALKLIFENVDSYLSNDDKGNLNMLCASNYAGKAINIAQTTAGHAMCYKLTSLYNIAHGHAVSLCVKYLWPYMVENIDKCKDSRGSIYLENIFNEISNTINCSSVYEAMQKYNDLLEKLSLPKLKIKNSEDYFLLKKSVNTLRLRNNPVELSEKVIDYLYHQILEG